MTDHHHHNGVSSAPINAGFAFAFGIILNTLFIAAEVTAGILANSTALLADAGHNISDVLGLVIAWAATWLGRRPPRGRYTYGFGSSSILAAQLNALLLLVAVGAIVFEAVERFSDPRPVASGVVIVVAGIGILINGATALLFARDRHHDINIRGAFLHMTADAAVSAGVMISGALIAFGGWVWLDPLVSLVIAAVIVWSTWDLLREATRMSLGAVPATVDAGAVRGYLAALPGVQSLHDLHIWPLSTTDTALTCHLLMPAGHPGDGFLMQTCAELRRRFGISHVTLQIELDSETACALESDNVV